MDVGVSASPQRCPPASPLRTNSKLRLSASLCKDDVSSGRFSLLPGCNQVLLTNATKNHSKNAFDTVFGPSTSQADVNTSVVSELVQSLSLGYDCSLVAFGAKSKGKETSLYGADGILHSLVESLFQSIEEHRSHRSELRLQLRLSALLYSQRENCVQDVLLPFNTDSRHRAVSVSQDGHGSMDLENESEIRVDSAEQTMFYLNHVADARIVEEDEIYRTSHLFLFFSLYRFRTNDNQIEGGRRRLSFIDLGIGERNSINGCITMPVLGSILMAIYQGQRHTVARENIFSQLLRCALSPSKLSHILCFFAQKIDDNENILQLASKLSRIKRNRSHSKTNESGSAAPSSSGRSEFESTASEMSAAETVIYVGPRPLHRSHALPPRSPSLSSKVTQTTSSSGRTCNGSIPPMLKGLVPFLSPQLRLYEDLCSPPATSYDPVAAFGGICKEDRGDFGITIAEPKKSKSRTNLDNDKRSAIAQWIENCEPIRIEDEHGNEIEKEQAIRECVILSHPLEDIIEQDEESLRESLRSLKDSSHPLRVLSKEAIDKVDTSEKPSPDSDSDALEKAMEASVSSIRSHDIMSKLQTTTNITAKDISITTTGTPSEMDLYRRASQLEEYACERVKELEERKKKKAKLGLNCCQNMNVSESTSVDWSTQEKKRIAEVEKEEQEQRRLELRARRDQLKLLECETRKERQMLDRELDDRPFLPAAIVRQITNQFQSFGSKTSPKHGGLRTSDSLPSTPTISQRKLNPPCRTPSLTNCTSLLNVAPVGPSTSRGTIRSRENSYSRKTSKGRKDRRSSEEDVIRSPYSKVTDARVVCGPSSSGLGSDDMSSDVGAQKSKKRQSYSASSGYESGNADYHVFSKDTRIDKLRFVDKRLLLGKEAESLRETQKRLRKELQTAKQNLGQTDDARLICHDRPSCGISQATLVDTLTQENRILEKRLVACRNHTMVVTAFL